MNFQLDMLKNYLMSFIYLLFFISGLSAQSFSFDPGKHHEETVSPSGYSSHIIYMENLTGGELVLGWELISMDKPPAWQTDLCDYISCYIGIPESGVMMAISDTTRGFLKIVLNPNDKSGTGAAVFRVFDNKHPEIADTCTFVIHAGETTFIDQPQSVKGMTIYPVPADDFITVEVPTIYASATLKIFNVQGQLFHEQTFTGERNSKINIRHLPGGVYLVQLTDKQGIIGMGKLLIR